MKSFINKYNSFFIVIVISLIGSLFRFYNLDWDNGNFFHPDERNIANAVSRIHFFNQLNPAFFAYGGFLIYLYRVIGDILVKLTNNVNWVYDWGHINLIGRFCSALFSTLSIPAIFLLTKKLFNQSTAITASLITAFTVSFIQIAHFSITENFLILISIATCWASVKIFEQRKIRNYLICGILLGIVTATKTTALSLVLFPLTAHIFSATKPAYNFKKRVLLLFIFVLISFIVFTFFSPYTFIKWGKFIESMRYESGVALGTLPVPYSLQFDHTIPYIFQIQNFFWQIGPAAYLIIPSFALFIFSIFKTKNYKLVLFLSFPIIYFLYVGYWHTKFIRFMLPILPFIIVIISYSLHIIRTKIKILGNLLIFLSIVSNVIWAFAFFSIYTKEQTRVIASKWIYKNISQNSKILEEHWDDGLPITITGYLEKYNIEQLTIYEPDNDKKINYYAEKLSSSDYIIINSRRLYATLINLPDKYPITSRYYKLLFNGKLGYKKIVEFSSYPSIFGIEINDDSSEETFQVYDHPKVIIFKNISNLSNNQLLKKFR